MNRQKMIRQLEASETNWDVLVIGGGATGLGIAFDAATRGYKTLLLEQSDFAKGTSSRSTKLIHGGVRYLAQGHIRLVQEALKERDLLLQNAAHLVKKQAFVIPVYTWWEALKYLIGLKIYDLMAGKRSLGSSTFISKKETAQVLPSIKTADLKGGIRYYDSKFDDSRLALNLAQTAAENGACILNYFKVTDLLKDEKGKICGVEAQDLETDTKYKLKANVVINATGVFVDAILHMEQQDAKPLIRPSQGVHIVLDRKFLPGNQALMIPKTSDGRVLFAVPWYKKLLVGTTDTHREEATLEPIALEQEIDFILDTAAGYLIKKPTRNDVLSVFAGLRPLAAHEGNPKSTKEISRNFKVLVSKSNLTTVTGGKWTIFRKMAEDTLDILIKAGHLSPKKCQTTHFPIHGHTSALPSGNLTDVYGTDAVALAQLEKEHPLLSEKLHPDYAYTQAQVVWAVRHEMARTVEDVLARRLRLLFLDANAAIAAAPKVAHLLATELEKDQAWQQQQINTFNLLAKQYLPQLPARNTKFN
jgi:glycerol-3-phosphate dehydrogenase